MITGDKHDSAPSLVLAAVGLALLTILSVWKLKQFKYKLINETGAAMFYGLLGGLTVRCLSYYKHEHVDAVETVCSCGALNATPHTLVVNITARSHFFRHVGSVNQRCPAVSSPYEETFDPEVLFNLFLPPIIFHGAYTLNQKRFIENLGSVLTFAFLGTLISCVTIGVLWGKQRHRSEGTSLIQLAKYIYFLYLSLSMSGGLALFLAVACVYGFTRLMVLLGRAADGDFLLIDCLLFGAIISATDPVSVLGLLSELRVDPDLHTLLFGESVLNDASAIVLTHAITTYSQMGAGHSFHPQAVFFSVGSFLGVLAGSFLLGFMFTVITALLTKFTRLCENPLLETSAFFLLSWSSFLTAKACGISGIVAVLFCGLSQARYTIHNLSAEGRTRIKQLFEVFNFLGEIFIFSYMGYVLLTFPHHVFKALFISGAFLSIFVSRACLVYPLSFLLNLGRTIKIPRSLQHFMMFAGLRGAVAFSMALRDACTEVRRTIFTTTLLLVCFTTWVLGMAADPMLRCLDISMGVGADENPEDSSEVSTGSPDTTQGLWHRLDYKYLKPLLTHCSPPLTDPMPRWYEVFIRLFGSPHVQEDEEQLCETEPDESNFNLEKTSNLVSLGSDSGSEHQEDLLEGDLGLGTAAALAREG